MVTLIEKVRNSMTAAATAEIDAGAGSNGTLEIGTASMATVLLTYNLQATSFGPPTLGTATANGLPLSATATAGGTAAAYQYKDKDGTVVISGTDVGTSGNEVVISPSTTINNGSDYDLTSASFTMPES